MAAFTAKDVPTGTELYVVVPGTLEVGESFRPQFDMPTNSAEAIAVLEAWSHSSVLSCTAAKAKRIHDLLIVTAPGMEPVVTKKVPSYILRSDRGEHHAGTIVYPCNMPDYGCAGDDSRTSGDEHISVTLDKNGGYPFFTVPYNDLEQV